MRRRRGQQPGQDRDAGQAARQPPQSATGAIFVSRTTSSVSARKKAARGCVVANSMPYGRCSAVTTAPAATWPVSAAARGTFR